MALRGIFASHQGVVGERNGDFASAILELFPTGQAPFFAITAGIPTEGVADTTFHWTEDTHISGRTGCASGGTTTTVVVEDGSFYVPNQILLVEETAEIIFVTAVTDNSLTVVRGMAGTSIVSITSDHNVQLIGNAFEEASEKPTPVMQQGHPRANLVQIFRNGWAISGTAKVVKFKTGDKLARSRKQCAQYHSEDMERSWLFGKKHLGTLNNKQFRMTDGVLTQIESFGGTVESAASPVSSTPTAGRLSSADYGDFIRRVFSINIKGEPNERISFNGDVVTQVLNNLAKIDGDYNFESGETVLGINIQKFLTPFGTLKLLTHPMMSENPNWAREQYVLHPGGLKKRMLRDTFEENYDKAGLRANGIDADEGQMTTEGGPQVGGARAMGIYRNIQRAVASEY